jgi:hypothetical protein
MYMVLKLLQYVTTEGANGTLSIALILRESFGSLDRGHITK